MVHSRPHYCLGELKGSSMVVVVVGGGVPLLSGIVSVLHVRVWLCKTRYTHPLLLSQANPLPGRRCNGR